MNFSCPGCSNAQFVPVQDYLGTTEGFTERQIVSCSRCQLKSVYPIPTPSQINAYYSTYWEKHDTDVLSHLFKAQAASRYVFLASQIKGIEPLKVLDIGAGFGHMRKYFASSDRYDAVEIDPVAVEALKNWGGAEQVYGAVTEADSDYDLVILSHILEHIAEPVPFLNEVKSRMKRSGIIFIEVPNKDFLYKKRNQPHLMFFEFSTLGNVVSAAGFSVLRCETCGMLISNLIPMHRRSFKILRSLVKAIIPTAAINKLRRKNYEASVNSLLECTSLYGGDRQWIRLVAKMER